VPTIKPNRSSPPHQHLGYQDPEAIKFCGDDTAFAATAK
jgi:hypothetical protein